MSVLVSARAVRMARELEVNLKRLKQFAYDTLPKTSPLRDILLSESEHINRTDFLAKMDVWIKLLNAEEKHELTPRFQP